MRAADFIQKTIAVTNPTATMLAVPADDLLGLERERRVP